MAKVVSRILLDKIKKFLKLRKLFSNWFFTLIEYKVLERPVIAVRCKDGSTIEISRYLYVQLTEVFERWNVIGCAGGSLELNMGKEKYSVPLKEMDHVARGAEAVLRAIESGWIYRGQYWEKGDVKFVHMRWPIIETFEEGQYDVMDVKGRHVVDVGAFIGDSAIRFALRGAEKVYAVEPHPLAFRELVENIELNGLVSRVVPINAGITYSGTTVAITDVDPWKAGASFYRTGESAVAVPGKTLAQLVEEYVIKPDALKMDCEGCEYDVILKDYGTVLQFEQVLFEYHPAPAGLKPSKLLDVMARNFVCRSINERFYVKYWPGFDKEEFGAYYCVKRR